MTDLETIQRITQPTEDKMIGLLVSFWAGMLFGVFTLGLCKAAGKDAK